MATQLYNLPFFADDLNPGERLFTRDHAGGSQDHGKDLTVVRLTASGAWSFNKPDTSGSNNEDSLIYGKPFYAMADGVVVGAWRNAPENPRPGVHHPALSQRLMVGGGNHLWILQDDGKYALYAHAQPGSIPASLCPHNAALFPQPHDGQIRSPDIAPEVLIPAGERPRVRKGQFLGLVGNTGSSSGPHLHVHVQEDGQPQVMIFERGLATDWDGGQADINTWTRFAGQAIPNGAVVIWPPRKLQPEYARHEFPAADFQRLFEHLADSGYALEWFDGYSVAGKPFFNFVWRPATTAWRAFFGQNASDYQSRINQAKADGLAPVLVESYLDDHQVRYAVIFKKITGAWRAQHDLSPEAHESVLDAAKAEGLNPINISVISLNGRRAYTVLYRQTNLGSWQVRSRLEGEAYQQAVNENLAAGRKPFYLNTYLHEDKHHYSVIFAEQPTGAFRAQHSLTSEEYQSAWQEAREEGFLTEVATGMDGANSKHIFAAVWRK